MFILVIPGGGGNQPDAALSCDVDARLLALFQVLDESLHEQVCL
jgi:hypothetical protein